MIKSLAYSNNLKNWDHDKENITSLDLTSTNFKEKLIENFPKLERFRATFCTYIKELTFKDCPCLKAVEIMASPSIVKLNFINCPNLVALDCSFSRGLKEISGDSFQNLHYFSAPFTELTELPSMPSLLYLDVANVQDLIIDINQYSLLEELRTSIKEIDISVLLSHEHLISATVINSSVNGKYLEPSKSLQILILQDSLASFQCKFDGLYLIVNNKTLGSLPENPKPTTWKKAALLLYGPWGVPEVDKQSKPIPEPVCIPPASINREKAADAIAGAIYGTAIMDMVGLGVEFFPTVLAEISCREHFDMTWTHPYVRRHNVNFLRGTATDDTSQAILIMRSLVNAQNDDDKTPNDITKFLVGDLIVNTKDFAKQILNWMNYGHKEHKQHCGLGCGRTVRTVLLDDGFCKNPAETAKKVWIENGKSVASNGCIMRNSPCGCLYFWDEKAVVKITDLFTTTTHYDPRCRFASICASLIQCRYIQKAAGLISDVDIDKTIEDAKQYVTEIQNYIYDVDKYTHVTTVEELDLGEENKIGYVLKALGSAIWAVRYATSFVDAMEKIISKGGDSDTNGAVVGALLGAKIGYSQLPDETLRLMHSNEWIYSDLIPFMALMDLKPPSRKWDL